MSEQVKSEMTAAARRAHGQGVCGLMLSGAVRTGSAEALPYPSLQLPASCIILEFKGNHHSRRDQLNLD